VLLHARPRTSAPCPPRLAARSLNLQEVLTEKISAVDPDADGSGSQIIIQDSEQDLIFLK
jgi:hypothetical protein